MDPCPGPRNACYRVTWTCNILTQDPQTAEASVIHRFLSTDTRSRSWLGVATFLGTALFEYQIARHCH